MNVFLILGKLYSPENDSPAAIVETTRPLLGEKSRTGEWFLFNEGVPSKGRKSFTSIRIFIAVIMGRGGTMRFRGRSRLESRVVGKRQFSLGRGSEDGLIFIHRGNYELFLLRPIRYMI
jgi:hypothetical protein